ncbi:hypothetical protein TSMEX_008281 [Taenia solium]|eukprot:TsM_000183400 transcript=TsM_000183400 gene=TsM_000183400
MGCCLNEDGFSLMWFNILRSFATLLSTWCSFFLLPLLSASFDRAYLFIHFHYTITCWNKRQRRTAVTVKIVALTGVAQNQERSNAQVPIMHLNQMRNNVNNAGHRSGESCRTDGGDLCPMWPGLRVACTADTEQWDLSNEVMR